MDYVAVVIDAAEKPAAASQPRRQGSLRLRALAPGSINVQAGARSAESDCHDAEVIPLLTPLHVPVPAPASDQSSSGSGRHLTATDAARRQHAEVAASGRCVAVTVEKTRWGSWWHPAMPFANDQPASSSVGFVFQNCV
ncbi:hypothetical protein E2562_038914 [Oryza meyeriana var. granulata]|uniref:Uncharacterized protein n=1 Tax=Oryza meyeriana var. granulata TaxID=110450 RepID=A0A6G1C2J9_9ORYZ|nr:hypothetical protein E2562_038914 [Oryza meyeriana var. granulata]